MPRRTVLPATWDVPQVFRDRLGNTVGRQRAMFADGHLLLVLHCPPEPDQDQRDARFIWRQPDGTWSSSDLGGGPGAVGKHLDQFAQAIDECEELDHHAKEAEDYFVVMEKISPIQRTVGNLQAVLQEARQAIPEDKDIINFRDRAYDLARTSELLFTSTKNAMDFAVAKRTEEQAAASHNMAVAAHRLNILAAFFFPLATLSSIFGMSFADDWKDNVPPMEFTLTIVVGLLFGFLLMSWVTTNSAKNTKNTEDLPS